MVILLLILIMVVYDYFVLNPSFEVLNYHFLCYFSQAEIQVFIFVLEFNLQKTTFILSYL